MVRVMVKARKDRQGFDEQGGGRRVRDDERMSVGGSRLKERRCGWMENGKQTSRSSPPLSKPGLADFSLAGFLIWMKRGLGETNEQWKQVESWNGGRWAKYLDAMRPYSEIHE